MLSRVKPCLMQYARPQVSSLQQMCENLAIYSILPKLLYVLPVGLVYTENPEYIEDTTAACLTRSGEAEKY